MGYYTAYTVTVLNHNDKTRVTDEKTLCELGTALVEISDWFDNNEKGWSIEDIVSSEMMKWYDSDTDMRSLSKQFPDYIFVLDGQGEESLDIWRSVFHNNSQAYYTAELTYSFRWIMNDAEDESIKDFEDFEN